MLVLFQAPLQSEGAGLAGLPADYAGDQVRAADPVCVVQVGRRPLRRMVRMRVIEADDFKAALMRFALHANQFTRIDVVARAGRGGGDIGAGNDSDHRAVVARGRAQQNAAAFLRVAGFAMVAQRVIVGGREFEQVRTPLIGILARGITARVRRRVVGFVLLEAPLHLLGRELIDNAGGNIGLFHFSNLEVNRSVWRDRRQ